MRIACHLRIVFPVVCWLLIVSIGSAVDRNHVAPDLTDSDLAAKIPAASLELLQSHCTDCHDGASGEGGFDVGSVAGDLNDPHTYEAWVRIYDRIERGEMPPPEDAEIPIDELKSFLPATGNALNRVARAHRLRDGRVQGRRLTNMQLQSTLQDLLGIDVPLSKLMPAETRNSGFVHLADSQTMSHFQLKSHLRVVDAALDAAFDRATLPQDDWSIDYGPEKIANKKPSRRNREPELRKGLAVTWSSRVIFYGRVASTSVRNAGRYRIELTASALRPPEGSDGVWCSIRSGECVSSAPLLEWIGDFRVTEEPKTIVWEAWIPERHLLEIRPADVTLPQGRFQGGQVGFGEGEKQDIPGIAMHGLKMQRIYPGGDVKSVRQRLFGRATMHYDKTTRRSVPDLSDQDDQEIEQLIADQVIGFANLAMRRPTDRDSLSPYIDFATEAFHTGTQAGEHREHAYVDALRAGYRAVLCSPRFLYLDEQTGNGPTGNEGRLDDWSVASRLSYFLCGSMPDDPLRAAAAKGQLQKKGQLNRQVDRLLATDRGQKFIGSFADQWLDLVDIGFTEPDRRLFGDFDVVVENAMLSETRSFLQHLLDHDRPIRELVDADYTFLNERLARYYELNSDDADGLDALGDSIVRVRLNANSRRGGLFSHGSVLKVTANGNDTSPILRGIWVCERILGDEIQPPPDNVPAVEPDIRGAKTIRELLAKHQSDTACASCHKSFDPPGFALENFDAGGKWRDHYRQLAGKNYRPGAIVDPSYTMENGREFETFDEFRTIIGEEDERLTANLASQLLVYATGAKIQFADRPVIQSIVEKTRDTDHGFRSVLQAVVASDTFLNK